MGDPDPIGIIHHYRKHNQIHIKFKLETGVSGRWPFVVYSIVQCKTDRIVSPDFSRKIFTQDFKVWNYLVIFTM